MTQLPVPGWYKDPRNDSQLRWWDGQRWTDRVYGAGTANGKPGDKPWHKRAWPWLIAAVVLALVAGVVMWPRLFPDTLPATPSNTLTNTPGARTYGGSDYDVFTSVAVAPDGSIVAVGNTISWDGDFPVSHGTRDGVVARFTPNGDLAWSHTYGGSEEDYFTAVAVAPDGSIIVAGNTWSPDGDFPTSHGDGYDAVIARLTSDGVVQWSHTYGGNDYDEFFSVTVMADDSIVAAGVTFSTDGDFPVGHGYHSGAAIARIAPDGGLQWAHTYSGSQELVFCSVAGTPDGATIAVGYTQSTDGDIPVEHGEYEAIAVRLTPDGVPQWSHTYGGSSGSRFNSVAVSPDGGIIIAGSTSSPDGDFPIRHENSDYNDDAVIARLGSDGGLQWATTYGGTGKDEFKSVAIAPNGTILAVGDTDSPDGDFPALHGDVDAVTVLVTPDGTLQSSDTYGGAGKDYFSSAAVAPDNPIIIAGYTDSPNGDFPALHGDVDAVLLVPPQP